MADKHVDRPQKGPTFISCACACVFLYAMCVQVPMQRPAKDVMDPGARVTGGRVGAGHCTRVLWKNAACCV